MDIFRQDIIDRFVLKLLNRHMILPEDFDLSERGCFLSKETNKKWVELYEEYMKAELSRLNNLAPRKSLGETVDIEKSENIS